MALAFSEVREGLGTSSALLESLEMTLGALGIFLVGYFFEGTIMAIAVIMFGGSFLSLCLYARFIYLNSTKMKHVRT